MQFSKQILLTIFVVVFSTNKFSSVNGETKSVTLEPPLEAPTTTTTLATTITPQDIELADGDDDDEAEIAEDFNIEQQKRSIDFHSDLDGQQSNEDRHAAFRKRAKPLKNIFLGLYKNYKSTYLGNKTLTEYRNAMRLRKENVESQIKTEEHEDVASVEDSHDSDDEIEIKTEKPNESIEIELPKEEVEQPATQNLLKQSDKIEKLTDNESPREKSTTTKKKRKKQRLRKRNNHHTKPKRIAATSKKALKVASEHKAFRPVYRYDFGHGYNMSLDMNNDIVSLNLDGESIKEIIQGRFLKEHGEGRGKKYEMITRVLPLFIIPFLIQSAIVPFLVTKLKLLLMKSILVGKLAIFLLIISAIKNGNKMMQTYEVAPSYWAGEPSRRSELAAAASAAAYNGYRVEGKPTAWIN